MILGPRVMSYCIYKLEIGKDNYIKLYTHLFQDYLSIYIYIYIMYQYNLINTKANYIWVSLITTSLRPHWNDSL